jgi:hypothetical protein
MGSLIQIGLLRKYVTRIRCVGTVAEIRYALEFVLQHFKDLYLLVYPSIRQTVDSFISNPRLLIFVSTLKEIHLFNAQARRIYLPRQVQSIP